jgi:hypothetical protein
MAEAHAVERMARLMERRYSASVLIAALTLIISRSVLDEGLNRLGLFLALGAGLALFLDMIDQRRVSSSGR